MEEQLWALRARGFGFGLQDLTPACRALPLGVAEWQQDAFPIQVHQAAWDEESGQRAA